MKKFIKKYLPDPQKLKEDYKIGFLGHYLYNPNLWRLNRYSVARAFSIALFVSMLPIPGHTVIVVMASLLWGANLPITLIVTLVNNPFTLVPIYLLDYQIGSLLLHLQPDVNITIPYSWQWFDKEFDQYWAPTMTGGLIVGTVFAFISYWFIKFLWYLVTAYRWKTR